MKLAVIGNSHGACLRQAVNEGLFQPEAHGISVDFFLSPSLTMRDISVVNGRLEAEDAELSRKMKLVGSEETVIDPVKFDAFLIIGLQFTIEPMDRFYSEAVKKDSVRDQILKSALWHVALYKLRKVTDNPVFVGHQPLLAYETQTEFEGNHPRAEAYEVAVRRYEELFKKRGIFVVRQPEASLDGSFRTKHAYSLSSKMLLNDRAHEESDISHMNSDYGALWWNEFAKTLLSEVH